MTVPRLECPLPREVEGDGDSVDSHRRFYDEYNAVMDLARDKQHFEAKGVVHYGIFSGRKYREMIYPRVREFIAKHH